MPTGSVNRAVAAVVVLGLLTAAVGPTLAAVAQQDYAVADGRTGGVDPGREDDDEQVFPINYTFVPLDHSPGVTNGNYEVYASGLTENITGHWVVLESSDFGFSSCTPGDASAFGIDRGNDDSGTTTDRSLLTAYKSYTSTQGGIYIEFYKESALAGEPIKAYPADQVVARQNNCMNNPDEPGWYRLSGHINGSTKHDTTTDYTIFAETQYVYVCDCASRAEAREQLGPPPNEQNGDATSSTATATPTPAPQATPSPTATTAATTPTATATASATATGTVARRTGTATAAPQLSGTTGTGTSPATAAPVPSPGTDSSGASAGAQRAVPTTPTLAAGPGFGPLLALLALLSAVVILSRNRT